MSLGDEKIHDKAVKLSADNFRVGGICRHVHCRLRLLSSPDVSENLPSLSDPACQPMTRYRQTIANRYDANTRWLPR